MRRGIRSWRGRRFCRAGSDLRHFRSVDVFGRSMCGSDGLAACRSGVFGRRRSRLGWLRSLVRRRAVELVLAVILSGSIGRWRGKARGERQMVRFAADRDDRLDPCRGTRVHSGLAEASVIRRQRYDLTKLVGQSRDLAGHRRTLPLVVRRLHRIGRDHQQAGRRRCIVGVSPRSGSPCGTPSRRSDWVRPSGRAPGSRL